MIKKHLSDHLIQYTFAPHGQMTYGYNIYVVIGNNRQCILLDSAFETHSELVRDDLLRSGIRPVAIIISHFHSDHYEGIRAFENIQVLGSEDYHYTFSSLYKGKDLHAFAPHILLTDGYELDLAGVHLKFYKGKGHSECSIITIINDEYVHVGDLLLADKNDHAILPLIGKNMIQDHIDSLKLIATFNNHTLLLSHGNPISGEKQILYQTYQRIYYLESLLNGKQNITIEEALLKCDIAFSNLHWHKYNVRNR